MSASKFIVVEHHAKRAGLHYDLRFKIPGKNIWMSFAVRKGVPLDYGKKVLAVRTHDHSTEEALFLGKLESGYGAGELKKWDDGSCDVLKMTESHILIDFKGRKLKGVYHMINTGVINKDYNGKSYMLFKGKDSLKKEK